VNAPDELAIPARPDYEGAMRKLTIGLLSATLVISACGDDDDDGGSTANAPVDVGEACRDTADVLCDRAIECFPDDVPSKADCVSEALYECCEREGACEDPARDDLSDADWQGCLNGLAAQSCDDVESGAVADACTFGG
jgi:hypothetical protein